MCQQRRLTAESTEFIGESQSQIELNRRLVGGFRSFEVVEARTCLGEGASSVRGYYRGRREPEWVPQQGFTYGRICDERGRRRRADLFREEQGCWVQVQLPGRSHQSSVSDRPAG